MPKTHKGLALGGFADGEILESPDRVLVLPAQGRVIDGPDGRDFHITYASETYIWTKLPYGAHVWLVKGASVDWAVRQIPPE